MYSLSNATEALLAVLEGVQTHRLLRLEFPRKDGPAGVLLVPNRLRAEEHLSRDFRFELELLSNSPHLAQKNLLGKMLTISLVRDDGSLRHFNGYLFALRFVKNDGGFSHYEAMLSPWLAFLHHRTHNRVFYNETVADQTARIFCEYRVADWESLLHDTDKPMPTATQFGESDHNYLHRRWESRGLCYWYEHRVDGHTLTLCEDTRRAGRLAGTGRLKWQGDSGVRECGVRQFSPIRNIASTGYEIRGFDFKRPSPYGADSPTEVEQDQVLDLARHEYTGARAFKSLREALDLARRRMQEIDAAAHRFEARGNDARVQPGRRFWFSRDLDPLEPGQREGEDEFLVLGVNHEATNNYQAGKAAAVSAYDHVFTCARRDPPWRPGRGFNSVDTKIYGAQTVIVCTWGDEESTVDAYGRVRVRFHWDGGEPDRPVGTYTWVRVATPSAGRNFGLQVPPRKGQELVCIFLDGDPDRPLIVGSVYNDENMPPWFGHPCGLPNNRQQSGLSTRELRGNRLQHLRFDDTTGKIGVQLGTDHAATQLNLGSLVTPTGDGYTAARGEGGELRSDAQVAVRGHGVLISSAVSAGASGKQLERAELIGLSQTLQAIVEQLGALADTHQAGATDPSRFRQLVQHLQDWEKGSPTDPKAGPGGAPIVAVSAVAGASIVSQDNLVLGAQTHIDVASVGNTQLSAGQKLLMRCSDLFSAFAHGAMKLISKDRLDLQADSINLSARVVTITASEQITFQAPKVRSVAAGVQVDWGGGRIVQQSSGSHLIKSSGFEHSVGGGGEPDRVGLPTSDAKFDQYVVLTDLNTQIPVPNQRCRIHVEDGQVIECTTDAQGTVPVFRSAIAFARYTVELLD